RLAPALAERWFIRAKRPGAGGNDGFHIEVADHQDQGLGGREARIEIIPHLAQALPFRKQHHQPIAGGCEGSSGARPLSDGPAQPRLANSSRPAATIHNALSLPILGGASPISSTVWLTKSTAHRSAPPLFAALAWGPMATARPDRSSSCSY